MQAGDKKLLAGVCGAIMVVLIIFRGLLLPVGTQPMPGAYRGAPPTVDAVTASAGPAVGGTEVLITGTNFGDDATRVSVAIGVNYCRDVTLLSVTQLTCLLPPGGGKDVPVLITVNGASNKVPGLFSYDRPKVTAVTWANYRGRTSGHDVITVQGANFGTRRSHVPISVFVGEFPSLGVEFINENTLEVITPRGFGKNLAVVVDVGGQKSLPLDSAVYSYAAPSIDAIDPETGPATGASTLYIYGANFGTHLANPKAFIGGVPCVFLTWRSYSLLECVIPAGTGAGHPVHVEVGGQSSDKSITFSYDAPSVSAIAPESGPTAGSSIVTVYGANFGSQPLADRQVLIGDKPCAQSTWISDTEITCLTPMGSGSDLAVTVAVDGQSSSKNYVWSYSSPTVVAISPQHGPVTGGTVITITGTNFGHEASHLQSISIDSAPCTSPKWISPTKLSCTTPPGSGQNVPVRVTVDGVPGRSEIWSYDAALLKAIKPTSGPAGGNIMLTITGDKFATNPSRVRITVGGADCPSAKVVSTTTATCLLPAGSGTGLAVEVYIDGIPSVLPGAFSYHGPSILDIDPAVVATTGEIITIYGESFGTAESTVSVAVGPAGSTRDCPVRRHDKAMIVCSAPAWTGVHLPIVVTIDGQVSEPAAKLTYAAPEIFDIDPASGAAEIVVTIFGRNFGQVDSGVTAKIGSNACTSARWLGDQRVECMVPPGSGLSLPVTVTVSGQTSAQSSVTFSYGDARPVVTGVSPATGPVGGGNKVTIAGSNLASTYLSVFFGDNRASIDSAASSASAIVVIAPPGATEGVSSVVVKIDDQPVLRTYELKYTYVAGAAVVQDTGATTTTTTDGGGGEAGGSSGLVVTSATATPDSGLDRLTIVGSGFATPAVVRLFADDGAFIRKCEQVHVASPNRILCVASSQSAGNFVTVAVGSDESDRAKIDPASTK